MKTIYKSDRPYAIGSTGKEGRFPRANLPTALADVIGAFYWVERFDNGVIKLTPVAKKE